MRQVERLVEVNLQKKTVNIDFEERELAIEYKVYSKSKFVIRSCDVWQERHFIFKNKYTRFKIYQKSSYQNIWQGKLQK